jgi:hypothetical protein
MSKGCIGRLRVNNSDVYNPLKAITVLLYRTRPRIEYLSKMRQFLKLLKTHFKSVENITDGRFVPISLVVF